MLKLLSETRRGRQYGPKWHFSQFSKNNSNTKKEALLNFGYVIQINFSNILCFWTKSIKRPLGLQNRP